MTVAPTSIDVALHDPHLLGAALGDSATWATWLAVLKSAFGVKLDRRERAAFAKVAGGRKPPARIVRELWAVAGRRSGKSRIAAAIAAFIAAFIDHRGRLAPGETGFVLVLAPTQAQAQVVFQYVQAFFQSSPILAQQIESVTASEIRLAGNIVVGVHPNSFRTIRGRTLLACIFDETAYWRDEASAVPDVECYRAVLPALATTGGMLIGISSPYRRLGLLHAKHRDHFGQAGGDVLVVQGGSELFNPTIDARMIAEARASDPEAAMSEWDAEFRSDIASLLDDAVIDAAIEHARPQELPPSPDIRYVGFVDASAGRHDAFAICIGHCEGENFVADVIRGRLPPFDPREVAEEFAALAKQYRIYKLTGDNYAGEWVAAAFKAAGIAYAKSPLVKSALYLEGLPAFNRGAVRIPNQPRLIRELRLLERRVARSGRDSVDHGTGGSDAYANVLFGAMQLALAPTAVWRLPVPNCYSYKINDSSGTLAPSDNPTWGSYLQNWNNQIQLESAARVAQLPSSRAIARSKRWV
jgi:hypothetical protein